MQPTQYEKEFTHNFQNIYIQQYPDPENRPMTYFDITIDSIPTGRIIFELFTDVVPKTCENFRQLCTGEQIRNGKPIGYKNTHFHRIVKDFVVQGGDFIFGNGKGSYSIYGETFPDENFRVNHNKEGILSMANTGPNTNGCQFFITLGKCPWLDGKHVAFGQVLDSNSMNIIKRISKVDVDEQSRPKIPVEIIQCGQM